MKKPLKPLSTLPANERIVGAGGGNKHLNPKSRPAYTAKGKGAKGKRSFFEKLFNL